MNKHLIIGICMATLWSLDASAQMAVQGDMILGNNSALYVNGNFTQTTGNLNQNGILAVGQNLQVSGGAFQHNGTLRVSGNWTAAQGAYGSNDVAITVFNGSADQSINHNNQTLANVIFTGGGQKLFPSSLTITGTMEMIDGILIPNSSANLVLAASGQLLGGGSNSYVSGLFYQGGTGTRFYPIGKDGTYVPSQLENIAGSDPVLGLEVFNSNPAVVIENDLIAASNQRYWEVRNLSGSFTSGNATLPVIGESFYNNIDNLVIAQGFSTGVTFTNLGNAGQTTLDGFTAVTSSSPISTDVLLTLGESVSVEFTVVDAFTPNGDGINDMLYIDGIDRFLELFPTDGAVRVTVFDRVGAEVYRNDNYDNVTNPWTGNDQNSGNLMQGGNYIVKVEIPVLNKNISHVVTLVR